MLAMALRQLRRLIRRHSLRTKLQSILADTERGDKTGPSPGLMAGRRQRMSL